MPRFLSQLLRTFRTIHTARAPRRAPRRANLRLEGLEGRLVLTSASFNPLTSTLTVNATPGHFGIIEEGKGVILPPSVPQITLQADPLRARLQVFDDGTLVPVLVNGVPVSEIPIASIKHADVSLPFLDALTVDDSHGAPFAPGTDISLSGIGPTDSLTLTGSRPISGGESYVVGGTAASASTLSLGGDTYTFGSTIGSVTDSVKITGTFQVSTAGQNVSLTDSLLGVTQKLSGIGPGAGGALTYSNKPAVEVDEFAANASVTLDATAAAAGEKSFALILHGANDKAFIQATPSTVTTGITAEGNANLVNLQGNSGLVSILGNGFTAVSLSTFATLGAGIGGRTDGIKQNVVVSGVDTLVLDDSGNVTTPQHVKVTESTISGTGLFGNSAAVVRYRSTGHVRIDTGTAADTYTIAGSRLGAHFDSSIEIDDGFEAGLSVGVTVDAGSGLDLHLEAFFTNILAKGQLAPQTQPPVSLSLFGLHGKYSQPTPTLPDGDEAVTFAGGLTSDVSYQGFTSVTLVNPNGTVPPL
jgi:hypothetical protein